MAISNPQKRPQGSGASSSASSNAAKRQKFTGDGQPYNRPAPIIATQSGQAAAAQQKSQFVEELEKMTQDIEGLRTTSAEKDQHWPRPPLVDFDPETDELVMQQIECEQGVAPSGKTAIKMFGITEVRALFLFLSLGGDFVD